MGINRPYRRTVRQFVDGEYAEGGRWEYIRHPKFAVDPEHYVRAFDVIKEDIFKLFEYIEPSDTNLPCYSYRIHEIFMRVCIEIEANFKAILLENNFKINKNWDMSHYRNLDLSHRLSSYVVRYPVWRGEQHTRKPFLSWKEGKNPAWYQDYNASKHNRHGNFQKANFNNLLDAVAALVALLSAQFWTEDFSPSAGYLSLGRSRDGFESAVGGYFGVKFPEDWPIEDRYDFSYVEWKKMENEDDPFEDFSY